MALDWSGFYVGLGIFIVLAAMATGMKKTIAGWMERVEWSGCGHNEAMY